MLQGKTCAKEAGLQRFQLRSKTSRLALRIVLLGGTLGLATPVYAYHLALKDGHTVEFQTYRSTETTLLYLNDHGKEVAVPLSAIDLERTSQLNLQEKPPLVLPGMSIRSLPGNVPDVSVAEAARKANASPTQNAKHTYNDDDVRHSDGNSGEPTTSIPTSTESASATFDEAEKFANTLASKTERELGEMEVGDVRFPGRDNWEARLVIQRDKLVKATLAGIDAGRRSLQIWSAKASATTLTADERFQLQEAQNAVKNQISGVQAERYRFDAVVAEGVKAASQWSRATNK
jgi:hypothetical protein